MRCYWAAVKGEAGAARFIMEIGLRPVDWTVSLAGAVRDGHGSCNGRKRNHFPGADKPRLKISWKSIDHYFYKRRKQADSREEHQTLSRALA
jgi:hypothetical protein